MNAEINTEDTIVEQTVEEQITIDETDVITDTTETPTFDTVVAPDGTTIGGEDFLDPVKAHAAVTKMAASYKILQSEYQKLKAGSKAKTKAAVEVPAEEKVLTETEKQQIAINKYMQKEMARKAFTDASEKARAIYGEDQMVYILTAIKGLADRKISAGAHEYRYEDLFHAGFNKLMTHDKIFADKYHAYKFGTVKTDEVNETVSQIIEKAGAAPASPGVPAGGMAPMSVPKDANEDVSVAGLSGRLDKFFKENLK